MATALGTVTMGCESPVTTVLLDRNVK